MDLTTRSNNNNPAHTKSPESDTDTETPLQTHLSRALSLTNASFQYHTFHHHHHHPPPQMVVSYRECLKNHAATLGGLALDGCGEFMPCPTSTPSDPTSLKCAACGCHRNFHRRDPYSPGSATTANTLLPPPPPPAAIHWTSSPSPGQTSSGPSHSPNSPASPTPQQSIYPSAPHMLLALSTGHSGPFDETPMVMNPHGRKRARTKFTEEQKEKMQVFAEKLGWKMVRGNDEKLVEKFCSEVGVKRNVFKVWMHNNKSRKEKGNNNNTNTHNSSSCDINTKISVNGTNEGRVEFENFNNNCNRFQMKSKIHVHGDSLDGSSPSSS